MKTIGKQLKPVILLLLALVMLFTAGASAVYAADANEQTTAATPPDNTGLGEITTGWLDITYGNDGITLTVTPDISAIKGITKAQITEILKTLSDAATTVIVGKVEDDVINSIVGEKGIDFSDDVKLVDSIFESYIAKYNAGTDKIDFFIDLLGSPEEQEKFTDYACNLITSAIEFGAVEKSALPKVEEIDSLVYDYVNNTVEDLIKAEIDALTPGVVIDAQIRNEYCEAKYGASYDVIIASIDPFKDYFAPMYAQAYDKAAAADIGTILSLIASVQIGKSGEALIPVFNNTELDLDAVKELIKTLPSIEEIAKMTAEEMYLSYDLEISINFLDSVYTSPLNVTLKVDPEAYKYIHRAATIINDHVDFSIAADGTVNLDVRMPAVFTKAVLKACASDKISEELKDKVFTEMSMNPDEAYAFFMNLDVADIAALIELVDIEGILDSKKIAEYVELIDKYIDKVELQSLPIETLIQKLAAASGKSVSEVEYYVTLIDSAIDRLDLATLTTEQVVNKVLELEDHFTTFKTYVTALYDKVPDSVKTKDLFSLYDGNGEFSASINKEDVDVEKYVNRFIAEVAEFSPRLAQYIEHYVTSKLNVNAIDIKANVSVSFVDIYKVEFYAPDAADSYRVGFLPAGADLTTFANLPDLGGKTVFGWVNKATGEVVTEMPDGDAELEPLIINSVTSPYDVTAEYEANVSHSLKADILANFDLNKLTGVSVSYQWYKNGAAIEGATAAEYTVSEISDSGEYYCEITVKSSAAEEKFTSGTAAVLILKRVEVNTGNIVLDFDSFVYDGTEKVVNTAYEQEGIIVTIQGNKATNAGTYKAIVTIKLGSKARTAVSNTNSVLYVDGVKIEGGEYTFEIEWTIERAPITLESLALALDKNTFTYDKTEHSVNLIYKNEYVKFVFEGDIKATNAGMYTAIAKFAEIDSNYVLLDKDNKEIAIGTAYEFDWTIERAVISIKDVVIALKENTFTYNGQQITVELVENDYISFVLEGDYSKKDAGKYSATAKLEAVDSNYKFVDESDKEIAVGTTYDLDWSISRFEIKYKSFEIIRQKKGRVVVAASSVYDGTIQMFVINIADLNLPDGPAVLLIDYADNVEKNVGNYTMTAEISIAPEHQKNYVLVDENKNEIADGTVLTERYNFEITARTFQTNDLYAYLELEKNVFTYNGTAQAPVLLENTLPAGFVIDSVLINSATDVGTYQVLVTVRLEDPINNIFVDEYGNPVVGSKTYVLDWTIEKLPVCIDDIVIALKNNSFVYNGTVFYVELANLPSYVSFELVGETSAVAAGKYTAIAKLTAVDPNYKLVYSNDSELAIGREFELAWTVEKASANVSVEALVNKDGFVYDGRDYSVSFGSVSYPHVVKMEISGNVAKNAGKHTAKIVFTLKDSDNYVLVVNGELQQTVSFELSEEWEIEKATPDFSGAYLGTEANLVADGTLKIYTVMGLPAGTVTEAYTVQYYNRATGDLLSGAPTEQGIYTAFAVVVIPETENYKSVVLELECDFEVKTAPKTFEKTDSSGKVLVSVTAENGIPEGYELSSIDISFKYDTVAFGPSFDVKYKNKIAKIYVAYDIGFVDENGDVREVDGPYTVKLRLPETVKNNTNLKAFYINAEDKVEEEFEINIENGYAIFQTSHFSVYSVGEAVDAPVEDDGDFPWWILLVIAVMIIIIIIVVLISKKKSKNEPEETDAAPIEEEATEEVVEETAEEVVEEAVEEVVEEAAEEIVEEAAEEVVEETVEETPATEETPELIIAIAPEKQSDEDEAIGQRIINGEVVLVSYRSSYMSRLIQADTEIQDYYTIIKNTLLSYKGVKSRTSWNFESFNKGRVQCAKLNLKGRALLVYIGLDPNEYNINKYHFVDVSDKPKFEKVPMLMKVKSDRGLKYVLELIEEMMLKNEIPQGEMPTENYRMPYETTEELVKRDLVKVILPPGVTLEEGDSIQSVNVGELIDSANANAAANEENKPAEEAVVEEAPAEEAEPETAVVEETPAEEAEPEEAVVEEAPAEEAEPETAVVEEAPVEETPAKEEIHVELTEADQLLTDEEAESKIEIIERTNLAQSTKLAEINLDTICENYENDETVDLADLQQKHLVNKKAGRLKVLARGVMTKRLTVVADKFSLQAVKMITLAGGKAEQLK